MKDKIDYLDLYGYGFEEDGYCTEDYEVEMLKKDGFIFYFASFGAKDLTYEHKELPFPSSIDEFKETYFALTGTELTYTEK